MMLQTDKLDWPANTMGDIDHEKVNPPYIRLDHYKATDNGDRVFVFDLRITKPNREYIAANILHSFEHFLLAGFRKYMNKNFINVAPMGCQTGLYLVLLNECRPEKICAVYENILRDIINAKEVPYATVNSCGQAVYHNLVGTKNIAENLLSQKNKWLKVL